MQKPRLSFWQIWNMSFGFLGIQFGWGLQQANMSAIYAKLGADPDRIPFLWLAGSVTGLIVQPIIGSMSDRTWNRLGRRRPYFLTGRSEEHTSELQSQSNLVCRLLLEKKKRVKL